MSTKLSKRLPPPHHFSKSVTTEPYSLTPTIGHTLTSPYLKAPKSVLGSTAPVGTTSAKKVLSPPSKNLLPPLPEGSDVYTIVFDLDETLVFNRHPTRKTALVRPHLTELLESLVGKAEVVLWTASVEAVGKDVLNQIDPSKKYFQHAIYRQHSWFREGALYCKDMSLLGRDLNKVIMIENTPESLRLQRMNGILVPDYVGTKVQQVSDRALLTVKQILSDLIESKLPVPEFISNSNALVPVSQSEIAFPATMKMARALQVERKPQHPYFRLRSPIVQVP